MSPTLHSLQLQFVVGSGFAPQSFFFFFFLFLSSVSVSWTGMPGAYSLRFREGQQVREPRGCESSARASTVRHAAVQNMRVVGAIHEHVIRDTFATLGSPFSSFVQAVVLELTREGFAPARPPRYYCSQSLLYTASSSWKPQVAADCRPISTIWSAAGSTANSVEFAQGSVRFSVLAFS